MRKRALRLPGIKSGSMSWLPLEKKGSSLLQSVQAAISAPVADAADDRDTCRHASSPHDVGSVVTHAVGCRDRLFAEIRVLKQLKHKNIMTFYDSWLDQKTYSVNFITEMFTSGTLRQ